jgi:hypothetical protein
MRARLVATSGAVYALLPAAGSRQLVRINPDDDLPHVLLPLVLVLMGTATWAASRIG